MISHDMVISHNMKLYDVKKRVPYAQKMLYESHAIEVTRSLVKQSMSCIL